MYRVYYIPTSGESYPTPPAGGVTLVLYIYLVLSTLEVLKVPPQVIHIKRNTKNFFRMIARFSLSRFRGFYICMYIRRGGRY